MKLAAALIGRPQLVFLDEPRRPRPAARRGMWELLRALRRDGVTVVMTTHQMDEAEALADHVVIVEGGRAVASGTLANLVGDERDVMTFGGPLHLDLTSLEVVLGAAEVDVGGTRPGAYGIAGEVTPQTIATVTAWCAQHGVAPRELQVGRKSLEEVFPRPADQAESAEPPPHEHQPCLSRRHVSAASGGRRQQRGSGAGRLRPAQHPAQRRAAAAHPDHPAWRCCWR